ncbi:MAG: cold shock domain-containing protein [Elusimicrobia bacterium]|nr:cold shock domain-containing protein [Elusimicrobiota bacterium]
MKKTFIIAAPWPLLALCGSALALDLKTPIDGKALIPVVVPVETRIRLPETGLPPSTADLKAGLRTLEASVPMTAAAPSVPSPLAMGPDAAAPAAQLKADAPLEDLRAAAPSADGLPEAGADRLFDGVEPMRRPLVEGWEVDGKEYASTLKMVNELQDSPAPLEAVYRFAHEEKPLPPARVANTGVGAVSGGALGAVLASALFVLGSIVNEVTGGRGIGPSELAVFLSVFGLGGAFVGAMIGWEESAKPQDARASISGRIHRRTTAMGETLYFAAERYGQKILVDLGAYAFAKPIAEPQAPAPWPAWKKAAAGFAAGAALAVSQWIPLVQMFTLPMAGPAVGAAIGRALTAGTGIHGGWLGGALGLLVPAAAFASFAALPSLGILGALGVLVAALSAVGAVVGLFAADAVRAEAARDDFRNPADQWWGRPEKGRAKAGGVTARLDAVAAPLRRRGTVKYWNEVRGYGFIAPKDGGEAVSVIAENIDQPTAALKVLREGEEVEFELAQTPQGAIAVKVLPVRLLPQTPSSTHKQRGFANWRLVAGIAAAGLAAVVIGMVSKVALAVVLVVVAGGLTNHHGELIAEPISVSSKRKKAVVSLSFATGALIAAAALLIAAQW